MGIPGFTATDSLFSKSGMYRLGLHHPGSVLRCGGLGEACCRAPFQNIPAYGPLVSCNQGLGCDITTNTCVSPCGGSRPWQPWKVDALGQVCCDGPETRAPKWTADGKIYSPTSKNLREMCDTGVCDKQTHRCITCGTHEGGPCCPSDAARAIASCFRDAKTGDRLVCSNYWVGGGGRCVVCGKRAGQPACLTPGESPCDAGLVEQDGVCVSCGFPGQPTCDGSEPCDRQSAVPNRWYSECVAAGGPNQPCRKIPESPCSYGGTFCNQRSVCEPCGNPGEVCCPPGALPGNVACMEPGECRDNRCFACGYMNMPVCPSDDPCHDGSEPVNGWCRHCGLEGEVCCRHYASIRCHEGMRCEDNVCRRPGGGGGGGGNEWKTCSGQPYTWSTKTWPVPFEDDNGCVGEDAFVANSPEEALQCARSKHGEEKVIATPLEEHTFAVTCSHSGCVTRQYPGRNHAQAKSCAEYQAGECSVEDGPCP